MKAAHTRAVLILLLIVSATVSIPKTQAATIDFAKQMPTDAPDMTMPASTATPSPMHLNMMHSLWNDSSAGISSDLKLSKMYEWRNGMVDMLNRAGNVADRDAFLSHFDEMRSMPAPAN